jgi:hypothetical protein
MTTEEVNNSGHSILLRLRGNNRAIFGRQLQGAEAPGASEEDWGPAQENLLLILR